MQSMQLFVLITSVVIQFKAFLTLISLIFQFCSLHCAQQAHLRHVVA